MYKFHLINTKRMSSKTRCDRVLYVLEGNTFLLGKDFSFYYKFKTNFSGHYKILGAQKNWGEPPPNNPWLRACL